MSKKFIVDFSNYVNKFKLEEANGQFKISKSYYDSLTDKEQAFVSKYGKGNINPIKKFMKLCREVLKTDYELVNSATVKKDGIIYKWSGEDTNKLFKVVDDRLVDINENEVLSLKDEELKNLVYDKFKIKKIVNTNLKGMSVSFDDKGIIKNGIIKLESGTLEDEPNLKTVSVYGGVKLGHLKYLLTVDENNANFSLLVAFCKKYYSL